MKKIVCFLICIILLIFSFSFKNKSLIKNTIIKNDTVLLVSMNFKDTELLKNVCYSITSFYKIPVKYIDKKLPNNAYISNINRYNANKIITYLKNDNYKFVVGLTNVDICTKKENNLYWGVFGLGTLNNTGCIISIFRMKNNITHSKLIVRTQKVVLHEIGHNYGINHCNTKYPCFMKDANGTIKEVDDEPLDMCKICKNKIPL